MKTTLSAKASGLKRYLYEGRTLPFYSRTAAFSAFMENLRSSRQVTYFREVLSPSDREVLVTDPFTGDVRTMLLFASNNYLNLATHPHVLETVRSGMLKYGVGIGGPPLLSGYSRLMRQLEDRLSAQKAKEATLLFSSGYQANLSLAAALPGPYDTFIYDELSHASLHDGTRLGKGHFRRFRHNDVADLRTLLEGSSGPAGASTFVGVEGVYSMDGDLCPLPQIVSLCKKHEAVLVLDDAHGSGVMGDRGAGTAEHFGVEDDVDIIMGTFSKAFAMSGGFISSTKEVVQYLRFFARPYMFSAALPPISLLALLGSLDVMENEPERPSILKSNVTYLSPLLEKYGLVANPEAAIICLAVPEWMDIRKANYVLHQQGIFLNAIEPPAVATGAERFRISVMVNHTKDDLDRLAEAIDHVWNDQTVHR